MVGLKSDARVETNFVLKQTCVKTVSFKLDLKSNYALKLSYIKKN